MLVSVFSIITCNGSVTRSLGAFVFMTSEIVSPLSVYGKILPNVTSGDGVNRLLDELVYDWWPPPLLCCTVTSVCSNWVAHDHGCSLCVRFLFFKYSRQRYSTAYNGFCPFWFALLSLPPDSLTFCELCSRPCWRRCHWNSFCSFSLMFCLRRIQDFCWTFAPS